MLIEKLSYDIQNIVGNFLNNKSKCRFDTATRHELYWSNTICRAIKDGTATQNKVQKNTESFRYITNIKIIDFNYGQYLTDKILLQPKFFNLIKLNVRNNNNVKNLNRFKKLTEIDISWYCGVDDSGICELNNLIKINAYYNPKIINLNRFKKLTEINIVGN